MILAIGTLPAMASTTWQPGTLTMLSLLSKSVYRRTTESMLGMSQRRYLALNYVAEPSGISQQQLGEILCMDANNTVLLLNELEDDGLVRRERDPDDRRRHIVRLTEQGAAGVLGGAAQPRIARGRGAGRAEPRGARDAAPAAGQGAGSLSSTGSAPMELATFQAPGSDEPIAGIVDGDRVRAFGGPDGVREALAAGEAPAPSGGEWPLDEVTLLAPVPHPGTVYAIGLNYAKHVEETGGTKPEQPIVFVKVAGSVAPPGGPIRCPEVVKRLDYEGELTIVIGADGQIGGYCVANDVSARDLQRREPQWTRAKGADTFCPYGPWITTADEIPDPGNLRLRTWVNGELRQDSSTADLIFGCDELVAFIAQTCTLQPGDLILTGTPNGVGAAMDPPAWLQSDDTIRIEIESLGVIEHSVV